jgi:hypothetical protein
MVHTRHMLWSTCLTYPPALSASGFDFIRQHRRPDKEDQMSRTGGDHSSKTNQGSQSMTHSKTSKLMLRTALAGFSLLAISRVAHAQNCSTETLNGPYSLSFHGETLGVLSGGVLTPFAAPNLVDGIELMTFDGAGNFTNLSLAIRNGVPFAAGTPGLTENGFQPQTGTYTVSSDCTGTGTITQPGQSFTFGLVLGNGGRTLRTVNTSQHVASIPNNPNCTAPNGCDVAVQISTVGERVAAGRRGD